MREILAQSRREVPNANHKKRKDNGSTCIIEDLPEVRSNHGHKEGREKERNSCENGSLALTILSSIPFQNFVDNSVPSGLCSKVPGALGMGIFRMKYRTAAVLSCSYLLVIVSPFLGIYKNVIGLGKKREISRGTFGSTIHVGMTQPRKLSISRLDFRNRGRSIDTEDFVIINHRAFLTPSKARDEKGNSKTRTSGRGARWTNYSTNPCLNRQYC